MADVSESDYGMLDYGRGYYSYRPFWLFESNSTIPFGVDSQFASYAFRLFEADATILFYPNAAVGVSYSLSGNQTIEFFNYSEEYIGPFWAPDIPDQGPWIPDVPVIGPWIPDVPISGSWNAISGVSNWTSHVTIKGPWIPIGPDLRPNDG